VDRLRCAPDPLTIWTIDGAAANSREGFFSALAATLQFPGYFGHNWDATYDCLTDLASENKRGAVLMILHSDRFLEGMGAEWLTGHKVFNDVAEFWHRANRLFLVLLVGDTAYPGVPALAPEHMTQVVSSMNVDHEITAADDRIRMLNKAGQFDLALEVAQDLVTRFSENPRAYFVLGGAFDFQGRELDAVPPYRRAWELGLAGDVVPQFYVQYGSTLRNVGQIDEAVRLLKEGSERFPDDAAIQAFLSLALFSSGQKAEALATALSILTARPDAVGLNGYERALREYVTELRETEPGG
jgi:tetratricopeptide (TPR) repeat protein